MPAVQGATQFLVATGSLAADRVVLRVVCRVRACTHLALVVWSNLTVTANVSGYKLAAFSNPDREPLFWCVQARHPTESQLELVAHEKRENSISFERYWALVGIEAD